MAENHLKPINPGDMSNANRLDEFCYQDRRMTFCGRLGITLGSLGIGALGAGVAVAVEGSPSLGLGLIAFGGVLGGLALNEGRHYFNAGSAIDDLYPQAPNPPSLPEPV